MSSAAFGFVHAVCKRTQKCLAQKVGHLCLLRPIPMIRLSARVAPQYEPGLHEVIGAKLSIQNIHVSQQRQQRPSEYQKLCLSILAGHQIQPPWQLWWGSMSCLLSTSEVTLTVAALGVIYTAKAYRLITITNLDSGGSRGGSLRGSNSPFW